MNQKNDILEMDRVGVDVECGETFGVYRDSNGAYWAFDVGGTWCPYIGVVESLDRLARARARLERSRLIREWSGGNDR